MGYADRGLLKGAAETTFSFHELARPFLYLSVELLVPYRKNQYYSETRSGDNQNPYQNIWESNAVLLFYYEVPVLDLCSFSVVILSIPLFIIVRYT